MKGQSGLAKTPAFTKPAGRGANDRRDVCDGDRVTLKRSIAAESNRAPRSCQVPSQQKKQRPSLSQLAAHLCRKTPEAGPVRDSQNVAAVQDGQTGRMSKNRLTMWPRTIRMACPVTPSSRSIYARQRSRRKIRGCVCFTVRRQKSTATPTVSKVVEGSVTS